MRRGRLTESEAKVGEGAPRFMTMNGSELSKWLSEERASEFKTVKAAVIYSF